MRWLISGLVLALTACGSSSTPVQSNAPTASAVASGCVAGDLAAQLGAPDGTAGTTYFDLTVTNSGKVQCVADQTIHVTVTDHGKSLVEVLPHEHTSLDLSLALNPGESLILTIGVPSPDNFDDADCHRSPSDGVSVALSSALTVQTASTFGDVCTVPAAAAFIQTWSKATP